jgi:hypothetical protein
MSARAPALRLANHWQPVIGIYHRFGSNAAATERARQKIDLQGLLADRRVQRLQIRCRFTLVGCSSENLNRALQQLVLPLRDLARMHVKALSQLHQGMFALDRCQSHLGF